MALVHTEGYQRWVKTKLPPDPALPNQANIRNAKELANAQQQYANSLQKWQTEVAKTNEEYFPATGVPEVKLRLFWYDVKEELEKPENRRQPIVDPDSIALCCMYEELGGVIEKKKQAQGLLDAVGDGTVMFTGRVWAEAARSGPHRVLLAEFGAEPIVGGAAAGGAERRQP